MPLAHGQAKPGTAKGLSPASPRHEVPGRLLRDIDGQAARVIKLRRDVRDQERHAGNLGHQASRVAAAADSAADRGLRKMLHDQAERLRQTAGNAQSQAGQDGAHPGRV